MRTFFNKISEILLRESAEMSITMCQGEIKVAASELDLDLTLLGGQSFRWTRLPTGTPKWKGVAHGCFWQLQQTPHSILFEVKTLKSRKLNNKRSHELLKHYLRLDFDLAKHVDGWKSAHQHFAGLAPQLKAVRVLAQDPLENILSFMCSQNNHIKRISSMINWLCTEYGTQIGVFEDVAEYSFPTLDKLVAEGEETLEENLRNAKFGYRAKFIAKAVIQIHKCGGVDWFKRLEQMPYQEARTELTKLPGIGLKVADCICLMSLGHLSAVPIDTHIYKIAQVSYMPTQLANVKNITPKIYDEIADQFRNIYGEYAGWAQAVLFCSGLEQFKDKAAEENTLESNDTVIPIKKLKK